MKVANKGYEIQVGDVIKSSGLTTHLFKVHRVTKKFAFVRYNEIAEGKFPRIYGYAFEPYPRQKWNMTNYEILIKE